MIAAPDSKEFCTKCLEFECEHVIAARKRAGRSDAEVARDEAASIKERLKSNQDIWDELNSELEAAKDIYGSIVGEKQEPFDHLPSGDKIPDKRKKKLPPHPLSPSVGRGPAGKVRNFRQMNDAKLRAVYAQCFAEVPPDEEVNMAVSAEMRKRGFIT